MSSCCHRRRACSSWRAGDPAVGVLVAADLRLQRGQGFRARLALRQRAARLLPGVAGRALLLLQRLHGGAQAVATRLAAGEVGCFLFELPRDKRDLRRQWRAERVGFGVEPFAPLPERGEGLAGVLAPRFGDAQRLFDLPAFLQHSGQGLRRGGQMRCRLAAARRARTFSSAAAASHRCHRRGQFALPRVRSRSRARRAARRGRRAARRAVRPAAPIGLRCRARTATAVPGASPRRWRRRRRPGSCAARRRRDTARRARSPPGFLLRAARR